MTTQAKNLLEEQEMGSLIEQFKNMPEDVQAAIRQIVSPVTEPIKETVNEVFSSQPVIMTHGTVAKAYALGVITGSIIVIVARLL